MSPTSALAALEPHSDLLVAIFTCLLSVFTLLLWRSTEKLWKTSQEQSKLSKEALITVERAFVFLSNIKAVPVAKQKERAWRFELIWKNGGATSTQEAITNVSFDFFDKPLPNGFHFKDTWRDGVNNVGPVFIGPQATVTTITPTLRDSMFVPTIPRYFYVWGWIDYNDVFDNTERHRTEFCYQIEIDREYGIGHISVKEFNFLYHREFNSADRGCLYAPAKYELSSKKKEPHNHYLAPPEAL